MHLFEIKLENQTKFRLEIINKILFENNIYKNNSTFYISPIMSFIMIFVFAIYLHLTLLYCIYLIYKKCERQAISKLPLQKFSAMYSTVGKHIQGECFQQNLIKNS